MSKSRATLLAALACALAVTAGCSSPTEPQSGTDTRTKQERDPTHDPAGGMRQNGGGGGMK
jgi:hypothetical protein